MRKRLLTSADQMVISQPAPMGHNHAPAGGFDDDDTPLDPQGAADFLGVSKPSFWRAVALGIIPPPYYIASRSPRWTVRDLRRAREAQRALPRAAMALRRAARLAKRAG
jgi:hypothetical protein